MKRKLMAAIILASAAFGAASPTIAQTQVSLGEYSLRLSTGMTEAEVIKAVGYLPNKAEVKTCGGETPQGPWRCRKLTFGNSRYNLTVYEQSDGNEWIVNGWDVND